MNYRVGKLSIFLIGLMVVSTAFAASDVEIGEGTEIELVDNENSSIFMGQDFNFTNVTVYGTHVEFKNNSVENNLTVYPNKSQEINSTLKQYSLNNPSPGTVFEIETEANSPVEVTYEVDAKKLSTGQYELFDNSSNSIKTFDGSGTTTWSETTWSNNTFTIEYTGEQVSLEWTDESDNEDQFNVYSNSSGQSLSNVVSREPEITKSSASGTGTTVTATHSDSVGAGEYICYKVTASNNYGESAPIRKCIQIPN